MPLIDVPLMDMPLMDVPLIDMPFMDVPLIGVSYLPYYIRRYVSLLSTYNELELGFALI
jgi:hypothetical protein